MTDNAIALRQEVELTDLWVQWLRKLQEPETAESYAEDQIIEHNTMSIPNEH